jgi:2-keto-4-pentenoate hydratase/2-oxohepta-3-ene-1,7-dioic acid hydratase in catechol pathway
VILTGTPAGIGATADPRRWLQSGDRVTVDSSALGTLSNEFIRRGSSDA